MKTRSILFCLILITVQAFTGCHFFSSFKETDEDVKSVELDRNVVEMSVGSMDMLNLSVKAKTEQGSLKVEWSYDTSVIKASCDSYGIVITALKAGTTTIQATCQGKTASCALRVLDNGTVAKVEAPYVYCSSDFVNIAPNETKKVYASLYGGTNADINGFSFVSDKPSVASVYVEGNYCWITGMSEGLCKITARHSRTSFSYSFLVNCSGSKTDIPYITTGTNIVTINRSTEVKSKKLSVDLQNSVYPTYRDDFVWEVTDEYGNVLSNPPVQLDYTGEKCTVTAIESGTCYIRVTHPSSLYSLEILCRIVENIDTAHITSSSSYVVVNGSSSETVEVNLEGVPDGVSVDLDKFLWDFSDDADRFIDYTVHGGSEKGKGNCLWITGKRNGSAKVTVTHPLSQTSKSIIITVRNSTEEAASSRIYITTMQNYIETKIGNSDTQLDITLTNISAGEENNLEWHIENDAADGSNEPVIIFSGCTGISYSKTKARSALSEAAFGKAYITPNKEGSAVITITHPKAAYPTKVLVKVLASDSAVIIPLSLSASSKTYYTIMKDESEELCVSLSNQKAGDEETLVWSCDNPLFSLNPNGTSCTITYNGENLSKAEITVSSPKASYPVKFTVAGFSEYEQLQTLKTVYTDKSVYTLFNGDSTTLQLNAIGYEETDTISWDITKNENNVVSIISQNKNTLNDRIIGTLEFSADGNSTGLAEITASVTGSTEQIKYYIEVKPKGIVDETKPCYLTTTQNVVTIDLSSTGDVYVMPVNIQIEQYTDILWTNNNPDVFEIASNGSCCTVLPLKEGNGTLSVSHPLSTNEITINVHVGSEYVFNNSDVAYISTESDTVLIKKDSDDFMFSAVLAHTESDFIETDGFSFESGNTGLFTVNYENDKNFCYITPKKAGQAFLRISHPKAQYSKEVLVIIEKSLGELSEIPYLSTSQNVVTVVQGEFTAVTVNLNNCSEYDSSKWRWTTQNGNISDVVTNNGNTAMVSGVTPGTTKVIVQHSSCRYQLEIIVICLDSNIVSANPFVQTNTNILNIKTGTSKTITSSMVGGSESDSGGFIWTVSDSTIALINGTGSSCYVKGLKKGLAYITVRNINYPDSYAKSILVNVEDTTVDECYISVAKSIVKLNPKDKKGENITAKLENGSPLDAQDFVWWADNYSVISVDSVTDTVSIVPTGTAGTTYVHVKHPKVLEPVDILVICSEYDEFRFSDSSKSVLEKSISFLNMEVPVSESDTWIEYDSTNTDVCVATGSNKVCMIAGIRPGSAKITACLKNASGVIAESELAVIVERKGENINTIFMNTTILNMNPGESKTLEALLSGGDIDELDSYSIRWEVLETEESRGVLTLLKTEQGITLGKNAYVTANKPGTAILQVSHPKCEKYPLTVWITVPEKETPVITLDQTYLEIFKGDGSATITAKVQNGTAEDENSIIWTAPKVGGINIISISKSKGKTCNIIPRNSGSTTLRAQLPNGVYADCVVTVIANAQLNLETNTVHVNPGYRETIKYTVVPESAMVDWQEMMNGTGGYGTVNDYFDFEVNAAAKTITIIGREIGSGYLYGYFASDNGTASAKLEVKCEYNYELDFEDNGVSRTRPRNGTVEQYAFHVYPRDMEIKAETGSNSDYLEIISYSLDEQTGNGIVYVKPKTEGMGGYIKITATNPNDTVNTPIEAKHYINSYYDSIHIKPVFETYSRSFSEYSGGVLKLGDGESVNIRLEIEEENADISNVKIVYNQASNSDSIHSKKKENGGHIECLYTANTANNMPIYTIRHNHDEILEDYGVVVSKHFEYTSAENKTYNDDYYSGTWDWHCHTVLWLKSVLKINGSSISFRKKYQADKTGTAGIYARLKPMEFNGKTFDIKEIQSKLLDKLNSGLMGTVLPGIYVINKKDFFNDEAFVMNNDWNPMYLWDNKDNEDKKVTFKFINSNISSDYEQSPIVHPWFKGYTNCKNSKITETAYGTISITYTHLNSTVLTTLESIPVQIEVRDCPRNLKGVWERVIINGNECFKCIDTAGLPDDEVSFTSSDNNYAYFEESDVELNTNNNSKTIKLTTNITDFNIELENSNPDVISYTFSNNILTITALKQGEAEINAKIKFKILHLDKEIQTGINVSVRNKEIYTSQLIPDDNGYINTDSYLNKAVSITCNSVSNNITYPFYTDQDFLDLYNIGRNWRNKTEEVQIFTHDSIDWSKLSVTASNDNITVQNLGNGIIRFITKSEEYVLGISDFMLPSYPDEESEAQAIEEINNLINGKTIRRTRKGDTVVTVSHPDCPETVLKYYVNVSGGMFD